MAAALQNASAERAGEFEFGHGLNFYRMKQYEYSDAQCEQPQKYAGDDAQPKANWAGLAIRFARAGRDFSLFERFNSKPVKEQRAGDTKRKNEKGVQSKLHKQNSDIKPLETSKFTRYLQFWTLSKNFKIALAFGPPFDRFCVPFLQKDDGWLTAKSVT